jgi:hypothetical protein
MEPRAGAVASLAAVSSLATTPDGVAREPVQATEWIRLGGLRVSIDTALGLCLALGLALVAFVASGGVDLGTNTWTEIVLLLIGCGLAVALLVVGAPGPPWGALTFGLFAALVLLTALSVLWSVKPDTSWVEAGRTLSYLSAFGSALVLARLFPRRWPALVGAVAVACTVICAYALLVKVFPATFDPVEPFGRLRAPFDYWNATGLIAALGLAPCLWAGARRERARALRALAVPAVAVLVTVIVLSYSRGAVLVAFVGLGVWFALVPLRLRGALVLVLGGLGAAVFSLYAVETHALTANLVTLDARTTAGHSFGVLLVLGLLALLACGFAAAFAMDRVELAPGQRHRIGTVLLVLVALAPVAGICGLASSSRGLTGQISHVWDTLTSTSAPVASGPTRLVQLGNSRGRYWSEGLKVGEHSLLHGVGALGYGTAVTRYTNDARTVAHAHSYEVETFADFGLIGVALMVAMLVSWSRAALRPLRSQSRAGNEAEHAGMLTMLAVVVVFGVHSSIDWTWFVPGTAVPALACAGWLAGRGPLEAPVGVRTRLRLSENVGRAAGMLGLVSATVVCGWLIWQPLRSENAQNSALSAAFAGHLTAAISDAKAAADENPVAVDPLEELSAFYRASGNLAAARAELITATNRQPSNWQTWYWLGVFDLQNGQPARAIAALERSVALNRNPFRAAYVLKRARAELAHSSP